MTSVLRFRRGEETTVYRKEKAKSMPLGMVDTGIPNKYLSTLTGQQIGDAYVDA